jgi:hypothetical protein
MSPFDSERGPVPIAAEHRRIEQYTAPGDLLPREQILEYLRTRE